MLHRSYCEEVLIVRVHPALLGNQGLPAGLVDEATVWQDRYRSHAYAACVTATLSGLSLLACFWTIGKTPLESGASPHV